MTLSPGLFCWCSAACHGGGGGGSAHFPSGLLFGQPCVPVQENAGGEVCLRHGSGHQRGSWQARGRFWGK